MSLRVMHGLTCGMLYSPPLNVPVCTLHGTG